MGYLQILNFIERILFKVLELSLPLCVEILELVMANVHVLLHLSRLNIGAQLILILDYVCFKESQFLHKIFVHLVFMHLAALFCKQLHLFFDDLEHQDLLVFIQLTITTLVKYINQFQR